MENSNKKSTEYNISQNSILRWILLLSGIILTSIGILGIFVPLLPTTIFFLLAAWCFARSSEKFHKWLHNNKYFGKYLNDYSSGKGMTVKSKIFSISMLWIGILASAFLLTDLLYIRILLLVIAIGVSWHLLAIKTAEK
ncbi:MAG: YbaN family protein [Ignavibacteria bacterium]|nr:YbaN family protein [Ignavibacteria bacterium]